VPMRLNRYKHCSLIAQSVSQYRRKKSFITFAPALPASMLIGGPEEELLRICAGQQQQHVRNQVSVFKNFFSSSPTLR
jgi:hypothetical protein